MSTPDITWKELQNGAVDAVKGTFPIEGRSRSLVLNNVIIDDSAAIIGDLRGQEKAKETGRTWGAHVVADISLVDKATNKVIDRSKTRIFTLPRPTERYSYIVDGSEWQVDNLWRLKPGVYSQIKANGELETEFALAGASFAKESRLKIPFSPENKKFKFRWGTTNINLYPILKTLGVQDEEMKKAWGTDIYKANSTAKIEQDIQKLYKGISKRGVKAENSSYDAIAAAVFKEFHNAELAPDTTRHTLGKPISHVTGEALLLASKRILDVAQGITPPDDRNSLIFKKLTGVDDFLRERLSKPSTQRVIKLKVGNNIDRADKVRDILSSELFSKPIKQIFTSSSLSKNPEQTNPLEMISNYRATTILGGEEGGIKSDRTLNKQMKLINPTHMGFLDPIHSPESTRTGISLNLPMGVTKDGNEARATVYDLREHKVLDGKHGLTPAELHSEFILLPDQVKIKDGKPVQTSTLVKMKDPETGEIVLRPMKDAKYMFVSPHQLFDEATNLIPFLQNNQGNRTMTASRQAAQAVGLRDREAPLVQVQGGNSTWEKIIGIPFSHTSPINGKIVAIKSDQSVNRFPDSIIIQDHGGKNHEVQLYNHFPLNDAKTFLHSTPKVSVGQEVKTGDLIADTNYTKDGTLTLGTNLRVSYLPYKGYNFEDGIVISNSAAKKLTSEHVHRKSIEIDPTKDSMNKKKFQAFSSVTAKKYGKTQLDRLDDDGVIRIGQKVNSGDLLIAAVGKKENLGVVSRLASRLDKSLFDRTDRSVSWDGSGEGEVVKVQKLANGKGAVVHVRTNEPAEVGDKIVGRHGNKAILVAVIPDHEMPRIGSSDGKHVEVLMNPSGVPSRINLGQMLETAASKIAIKTGKPYIVNNFDNVNTKDYTEKVKQDLKDHNLKDTEEIYDPVTHKKLGDVLTGDQYIMKLKHQVEKKLAVRSTGNYTIDRAPKGTGSENPGQGIGQLEFYALLAHGARANLKEMATYKADQQVDERLNPQAHIDFWHRVQMGQPLPPPHPTFAYRKFESYLKGLGINVHKEGHEMQLIPLTDKGVLEMSNGEIADPGRVLRGKDAKELEKGLFDPKITGGLPDANEPGKGLNWSHITLARPMPSPVFVGTAQKPGPAVILTGLKFNEFEDIVKGKKNLNGKTGGEAIKEVLDGINVKKELSKVVAELPTLRGSALNHANRKAKYLRALDSLDMKPSEAYMMNHVPVIPPVFRPIVPMPDGSLRFDDINHLYKDIGIVNNKLKEGVKELPEVEQPMREELYDLLKSSMGIGGIPQYESSRKLKGILDTIAGTSPKFGFFQKKLMKRRQELSMRSTIIPEPAMHLDYVGIPRTAAMELYKPFVIRELKKIGRSPLEARKDLKEETPAAWRALERALESRPVLLKRDPALHKFSIMAFKPKLVDGKAIRIHPLVTSGFNADFDGDSCIGKIITCNIGLIDGIRTTEESSMPHIGSMISYQAIEIKDFPRIFESQNILPSGVTEYDVPSYVYVPGYLNGQMKILPVTKFSIHPNCQEWLVRSSNGREIRCSADHSLALFDPTTLTITKSSPIDSVGRCFPVMRSLVDPSLYSHIPGYISEAKHVRQMEFAVPLNREVGWFIGATIGDGWTSGDHVAFASGDLGVNVKAEWSRIASYLSCGSAISDRRTPHEFDGSQCVSTKTAVSSTSLSRWLSPLIGHTAQYKHLPPRFLEMPEEFRRGLFCGLIDTDGTVNWNKRGQFAMAFNTSSKQLMDELVILALSLGLHGSVTETVTPKGEPFYVLPFSIKSVQQASWIQLFSDHRRAALHELWGAEIIEPGRNDFVPMTEPVREELLTHLRNKGASVRPPNRNPIAFSLYVVLQRHDSIITRESIEKLYVLLTGIEVSPYLARWFQIALDPTIGWDVIESAIPTGFNIEMYDITVPEAWTFTMANGAVVWDTMSAFLPLTDDAVRESHKMFPSNNLFSSTHGGVMYVPSQEALLGLHLLSKWGEDTGKKFPTFDHLKKEYDKGSIKVNDVVSVNGKPTTYGRRILANQLPKEFQSDNLLYNPHAVITKKGGGQRIGILDLLSEIGKKDPKKFAITVDHLKDVGNQHAYDSGFSLSLNDLEVHKDVRDKILAKADEEAEKIHKTKLSPEEKESQLVSLYDDASHTLDKAIRPLIEKKHNNIYTMMDSGARGTWAQFRQMAIAPMVMQDATGRKLPTPVKKSYSEGLDIGDYWTALHGARMGTLQRAEGTSEPGMLTKDIINFVMPEMIVSKDCGTKEGISMNITDDDVHDRLLAKQLTVGNQKFERNTIVTPALTSLLKKNHIDQIVVRSPLKCQHGIGMCSKCFGLNENGVEHEVGTNIGVIAGHSLGEPAMQLAMDAFHTGGTSLSRGAGATTRIGRLKELLKLPAKLPDSATLARTGGKVDKIEKDPTGWNVYINGQAHFSPATRKLIYDGKSLEVGTIVKKGAPISEGPINPRELLPLTDIPTVQNHLVTELYDGIYKDERVRRRNIETIVRSLTNLTQIKDPGDTPDFMTGDIVSRSLVEEHNRNLESGHTPIEHRPVLKGMEQGILDSQEDWLARLNFRRLKETIMEGAAKGWKTNLHGTHPVPAYVVGNTFGEGTEKEPWKY